LHRIFVEVERCLACRSCELSCAVWRDSVSKTLMGAVREGNPRARVRVVGQGGVSLPVQCRQCSEGPCIEVCPTGAMRQNEDGLVLLAADLCTGCLMCAVVCPFGAIIPCVGRTVPLKCDGCEGMEAPYCVQACPTGALKRVDEAQWQRLLARRAAAVAGSLDDLVLRKVLVYVDYARDGGNGDAQGTQKNP